MTPSNADELDRKLEDQIDGLVRDLVARHIVDVDGVMDGVERAVDAARRAVLSKMLIDGLDPSEIDRFETTLDDALDIARPQMRERVLVALASMTDDEP